MHPTKPQSLTRLVPFLIAHSVHYVVNLADAIKPVVAFQYELKTTIKQILESWFTVGVGRGFGWRIRRTA